MLNKLISEINKSNFKNFKSIQKVISNNSYDTQLITSCINTNKDEYHKKLIYRNSKYEMFLIYWGVNSKTKIHDHSEEGCIMKILKGDLRELVYNENFELIDTNNYKEGDISFIDNKIGYHKIINTNDNISKSLHIYSPPNHQTKYFK